MVKFKSIEDMPNIVTYAGWRIDTEFLQKVTDDFDSVVAAEHAVRKILYDAGLHGRQARIYTVEETKSYKPCSTSVLTAHVETYSLL